MIVDTSHLTRSQSHRLLGSAVAPRPIALISTIDESGRTNMAPFSAYTLISSKPPIICFSAGMRKGEKKDTVKNIEVTGDFVVNAVVEGLMNAVIIGNRPYPQGVSEIEISGLTPLFCSRVKSPRIDESPINMECKLVQTLTFGESNTIIGEVLEYHIKDEIMDGDEIDMKKLQPIGRLTPPNLYSKTTDVFQKDNTD